ncbi:hypothetical protein FRB99_002600 [Tulasnella sp. 403]|nr:hypothetical protein FRB99_002600 [Tulasnella sp. 403]
MTDDKALVTFQGRNSSEAQDFIRKVYEHAAARNKLADNQWIADYASSCLQGEALTWYETLNPSVRRDWGQFQVVLVQHYVQPTSGGELSPSLTTRSPQPGSVQNRRLVDELSSMSLRANRIYTGRIRVVSDNPTVGQYIARWLEPESGTYPVTHNVADAAQVRFMQSLPDKEGRHAIEIINSPTHLSYAALATTAAPELNSRESSFKRATGPVGTAVWVLGFDGRLRVLFRELGAMYSLTPTISLQKQRMLFTSDYGVFSRRWGVRNYAAAELYLDVTAIDPLVPGSPIAPIIPGPPLSPIPPPAPGDGFDGPAP